MSLIHGFFKKLINPFQRVPILRAEEHRKFLKIWLSYVVVLALLYMVLPVTFERNWLDFFEPMQNGYLPYIDFHVGYPPIGFLTFLPLVFLSNFNLTIFSALMRTINAFFLIMAVLLIYLIVYKVRDKRDAIISALIVMVSFSTISYNRHSNESIALFFALLAVYFMLDRKICSAGLAIGLGAMVKIIPGLLVIPAFKRFKGTRERVLLLGSAYMVILLLNLPFVIVNPFMWLGTYLYNGARGPWETIWALIEGWYGHGGAKALHPYFEAFIPYTQLMTFYHPSPHDQAYYAWHYPWLPTLLFILGIASLLLSYCLINKHDVTKGVALTLFLFMFFSKGYSPQFTIFMLPFMAMALEGTKKIYLCAMLETGTILQWIVWGLPGFYSPSLLALAVILRTIPFVLVIGILMTHFMERREAVNLSSIGLPHFRNLKSKFLVIFIVSILIVGGSAYYLIDHYSQFPQTVKTHEGTRDLKLYETVYVPLPNLTENQRVMFNLTSRSPINVTVTLGDEEIWAIKTPKYGVKNLFVSRDSGDYSLAIYMTYPASHFEVIDETEGDGLGRIEQMGDALNATVIDFGGDNVDSILKLSWPVDMVVTNDFRVKMMVWQFGGHINKTFLSLSTASSSFEYEVPSSDGWHWFEMNSSSITFDNRKFSHVRGNRIETIDVAFSVNNGARSGIGIKNLEVWNGESAEKLDLTIENTSEVLYKIYFAQMYSLPDSPMVYVSYSILIVGTTMAWVSLYKRFKKINH